MSCLTPARRVAEEKGCSGLDIKIRADARRSGDFYAEADRISLRRTFSQVKQPIQTRLSMVRPDSKWLPRQESPGKHNRPCCHVGGGSGWKIKNGNVIPQRIMSAHRERYGIADPWMCAVFIRVD